MGFNAALCSSELIALVITDNEAMFDYQTNRFVGSKHQLIALRTARRSLETQYAEMMKRCAEKVTELCKLEKQTWQIIDTLNEKCDAMVMQIDTTAEQQVCTIVIIIRF